MEYWIGVDIGTTNTKVVTFTEGGDVKGHHSVGYEMIHPQPDYSELDAEVIYQAVHASLQTVLHALDAPVRTITFCSAMHSVLAVDEAGQPLSNLIIWADNRATEEAESLIGTPLGKELFQACGTPLHPMVPLCKLMWLQKYEPELVHKAYKFVGIKELIWYRLTGEWVVDYSIASATAMFDLRELKWNEQALKIAGIPAEKLSATVSPYHSFPVSDSLKQQLQITSHAVVTEQTKLIIGASDGCVANLGTGAVVPGRVAVTIGTSGAVRVSARQPLLDEHMRTFCYLLDTETYIIGGGTNSGGVIFQWLGETLFPDKSEEELSTLAAESPTGANDLLFLPYLLGERAPIWNVHAKGGFHGLTLQHTASHLVRAVLEGICLHTYSIVKILEDREQITEIYASGGFAKSPFWVQMLADICGKPVCLPETVEAGAWGSALMGMKAEQVIEDYQERMNSLKIRKTFNPDLNHTAQYQRIFERFMKLYEATKSI
ncbi:gluconokinase [Siphonobacter sp.]|uniref:gluconokinase n=1 Tax=Siphonobacter sp. TaxID=1869184 RepID=UPI003B3A08A1